MILRWVMGHFWMDVTFRQRVTHRDDCDWLARFEFLQHTRQWSGLRLGDMGAARDRRFETDLVDGKRTSRIVAPIPPFADPEGHYFRWRQFACAERFGPGSRENGNQVVPGDHDFCPFGSLDGKA